MIQTVEKTEDDRLLQVFEDAFPSVEMFFRLGTQWNAAGMGSYTGLNYTSVESLFNIFNVSDRTAMFDDLRIMERAALEILNRKDSHG